MIRSIRKLKTKTARRAWAVAFNRESRELVVQRFHCHTESAYGNDKLISCQDKLYCQLEMRDAPRLRITHPTTRDIRAFDRKHLALLFAPAAASRLE